MYWVYVESEYSVAAARSTVSVHADLGHGWSRSSPIQDLHVGGPLPLTGGTDHGII
jgi:hypothetical protein